MRRSESMDDLGRLLLRLAVGGLMLFHGVAKLQHGVGGVATMLARKGLPGFIAYGALVGEVVAPLLVIAGLFTRPAAAVIAFNMLVATWLVHLGDAGRLATTGGWRLELQALYLLGAVAIALLGAGRLSARRGRGRWD